MQWKGFYLKGKTCQNKVLSTGQVHWVKNPLEVQWQAMDFILNRCKLMLYLMWPQKQHEILCILELVCVHMSASALVFMCIAICCPFAGELSSPTHSSHGTHSAEVNMKYQVWRMFPSNDVWSLTSPVTKSGQDGMQIILKFWRFWP